MRSLKEAAGERAAVSPSDADLVQLCLAGDASACDILVRTYWRRVFNIAYKFVAQYDEAEDTSENQRAAAYRSQRRRRGAKARTQAQGRTGAQETLPPLNLALLGRPNRSNSHARANAQLRLSVDTDTPTASAASLSSSPPKNAR